MSDVFSFCSPANLRLSLCCWQLDFLEKKNSTHFPVKDMFLENHKSRNSFTFKTTLEYMLLDIVAFNNSLIFLGNNFI